MFMVYGSLFVVNYQLLIITEVLTPKTIFSQRRKGAKFGFEEHSFGKLIPSLSFCAITTLLY